jgi:hypothetical protein
MTPVDKKQRVILEAEVERSVIRGTLVESTGNRREFHGWLELNAALEAMLDAGAGRAPSSCSTTEPQVQAETQRTA